MLVLNAGSVMIDKVRFFRKRILRRAGAAFACTCIASLRCMANSEDGVGFAQGDADRAGNQPAREFVTHVRGKHASNEDDFRLKVNKHHKLVRTLQGY